MRCEDADLWPTFVPREEYGEAGKDRLAAVIAPCPPAADIDREYGNQLEKITQATTPGHSATVDTLLLFRGGTPPPASRGPAAGGGGHFCAPLPPAASGQRSLVRFAFALKHSRPPLVVVLVVLRDVDLTKPRRRATVTTRPRASCGRCGAGSR